MPVRQLRTGAREDGMSKLEQQLQASVELLECVVPRERLPSEEQLHATHAQLARVIRERVKVWRSVG